MINELREQIEQGDYVTIDWEHLEPLSNVLVLYAPVAPGDCWQVKNGDGTIFYVQTFARMRKIT